MGPAYFVYGAAVAVIVRTPSPAEWRAWRALRLRALGDAPDAFGETLADAKARDDASWRTFVEPAPDKLRLIAERDGVLVGMCVIVLGEDRRTANLYAMWVAPWARGMGIGRRLVDTALRWTRAQAALQVTLRVSERHPAARGLYERCGFRDTGERTPLRPGSDVSTATMIARLPPLVMGVVNVTPDSFSDGGAYLDAAAAVAHGEQLIADGADILDIGGEATNPRATPVDTAEELRRVVPVIERLIAVVGSDPLGGRGALSIDTTKSEVARAAVGAGATIINDVSGGLFDPRLGDVVRAHPEVTYIAGHLRGRTLAEVFAAEGAVTWPAVAEELVARLAEVAPVRAWIDPGIGFGKGADPDGNVALLRHAGDIASTIRRPIVVGPSRKRFLRRLLGVQDANTEVLDAASVLASLAAVRAGAQVVRIHNVALLKRALTAYNKE
jgi:dihydropteroate synthase